MRIVKRWASFVMPLFFLASSSLASAAMVYIGQDYKRPAAVKLPANYDPNQSYPLILLLHGYGSGGAETINYLEADAQQASHSYIYLTPQATVNAEGLRSWNAVPPQQPGAVNDSAYLQGLVAEVQARWNVDVKRIYIFGISNGGFMAYRLACDTDGLFAGIVSITGAMFSNSELCQTKTPISVLQIHGTKDEIVPYVSQRPETLGAFESSQAWAQRNGCQTSEELPASRDLMLQPSIPGIVLADGAYQVPPGPIVIDDEGAKETDQVLWSGCSQSVKVGLWRMNGGTHVPDYSGKKLITQALEFLSNPER